MKKQVATKPASRRGRKAPSAKTQTSEVIDKKTDKVSLEEALEVLGKSTDHLIIENTGSRLIVPEQLMIFAEGLADLYKGQIDSENKAERDSAKNALTLLKALVGRPRLVKGEIVTNGIGVFTPNKARALGDRSGFNLVVGSSITSTTYGS